MPIETRLRTGVTLSVMVNLACATAAVFSAAVAPNEPGAERVLDTAAPAAAPPRRAVAAFVASAPVAWAALPPALAVPSPAADGPDDEDVEGGEQGAVDIEVEGEIDSGGDGATIDAEPDAEPSGGDGVRTVSSTGYCLDGVTASGGDAGPGGVAMNGVALGSTWRVLDGSLAGSVLTVNDRIGRGSDFDVWFDDCDDAAAYGRQTVSVVPGA